MSPSLNPKKMLVVGGMLAVGLASIVGVEACLPPQYTPTPQVEQRSYYLHQKVQTSGVKPGETIYGLQGEPVAIFVEAPTTKTASLINLLHGPEDKALEHWVGPKDVCEEDPNSCPSIYFGPQHGYLNLESITDGNLRVSLWE